MYAAYIERRGPASEIQYGRLPTPEPGPTDVLVRVAASAVNHVDTFVRSGAYETPLPLPFVIGRDLVGTAERTGPGAPGFAPGEWVWANSLGHAGRQGATAEYAVVAADRLYPLPSGADAVDTVALVHPAATAYLALFRHGRLAAGETVLVAGGAGHVGRAAIVLAALAGARVVATASAADLAACRDLGAEVAVDYRASDAADQLRAAAPTGVDVHLDTSGHHDLVTAVDLLAPRGRIMLMAGLGQLPPLPDGSLYTRDGSIHGFAISNARVEELADAAERINQLIARGVLRPGRVEELPLNAAADAHERLETGRARGVRLVLRPPHTASSAGSQP
jgi:NADPH:quinone reductase-like Zn-dependent oxidoreductase